jgi:hypothetical protein
VDIINKLTKSRSKACITGKYYICINQLYGFIRRTKSNIQWNRSTKQCWEQIAEGIDLIVDLWLKSKEK